jgi:hypothetical protein
VKYLTVIFRDVHYEDDQNPAGVAVYRQLLINGKLKTGNVGQKKS